MKSQNKIIGDNRGLMQKEKVNIYDEKGVQVSFQAKTNNARLIIESKQAVQVHDDIYLLISRCYYARVMSGI